MTTNELGIIESSEAEKLTVDSLVDMIASYSGTTKADARRMLQAFTEVAAENLGEGKAVSIPGMGTFSPKYRESIEGVAPNGSLYKTPPEYLVRFRAFGSFRKRLKFDQD